MQACRVILTTEPSTGITKHFRYLKWRNPHVYKLCMDTASVKGVYLPQKSPEYPVIWKPSILGTWNSGWWDEDGRFFHGETSPGQSCQTCGRSLGDPKLLEGGRYQQGRYNHHLLAKKSHWNNFTWSLGGGGASCYLFSPRKLGKFWLICLPPTRLYWRISRLVKHIEFVLGGWFYSSSYHFFQQGADRRLALFIFWGWTSKKCQ